MRPQALGVVLMLAVSTTASAQNFGGSSAQWFHVRWEHRGYGAVPVIEGYVQNDSPFWVTNVRLQIDGVDGGGRPVAQAFGWTFGDIAPGGATAFVVETMPRAVDYRISVSSFDVVSANQAPER